jgi:hypothetical protein
MQVINLGQLLGQQGGEPQSPEQLAAMQAHADQVHERTHEVEAEIRAGLVRYAALLCTCPKRFTRFTMASPPAMAECVIHGQAQFLFGERPECDHE